MTKVDIFSGFLGAGKTTLIKKLIKEAYKDEKLVLIENEFGEIGIDGGFLKEAGIEITEMNSGCICCSLVGDFGEALKKVLKEFAPDRILIEPSGVGKLSDVIRAVQNTGSKELVLNSFTTVVDVSKCKIYMKNFGEFFNDQLSHAGCIILSHSQKTSDEKISECVSLIRKQNEDAIIVSTPWSELSGEKLLSAMERKNTLDEALKKLNDEEICPVCGHHHDHDEHEHHHDHDEHEHHDHDEHEHHHDHDEHEHHNHDEHEHHDHDEHEHHHDHDEHDENCTCGCHDHDHHDHDEHEHHDHDEHEHHHDHDEHDENCTCGCHDHDHDHHHHADDVFVSWGVETTRKYKKEEIESALKELEDENKYGLVLRAKGIVAGDESWIHYDYVPGEIDLRDGSADIIGRLCVIGSKLNKEAIAQLFKIN
ncbi:MAG: GTP-binding protein [Bacillota bacterium]|nr:GTP-binding protein [Bacillota bacterium]